MNIKEWIELIQDNPSIVLWVIVVIIAVIFGVIFEVLQIMRDIKIISM